LPDFGDATCVAIACPACMTLGLAQSCAGYVTTVINNTDMVPTMSLGESTPCEANAIWRHCLDTRVQDGHRCRSTMPNIEHAAAGMS
jgi:hypothetical protein